MTRADSRRARGIVIYCNLLSNRPLDERGRADTDATAFAHGRTDVVWWRQLLACSTWRDNRRAPLMSRDRGSCTAAYRAEGPCCPRAGRLFGHTRHPRRRTTCFSRRAFWRSCHCSRRRRSVLSGAAAMAQRIDDSDEPGSDESDEIVCRRRSAG